MWNSRASVLDQLAEIDALLGQEVEDDPLAAEEVLDVDELHGEAVRAISSAARVVLRLLRASAISATRCSIVRRERRENLAAGRVGDGRQGLRRGRAEHFARFRAASVRTTTRSPRR